MSETTESNPILIQANPSEKSPLPGTLGYSQLKKGTTPPATKKGLLGKIARLAATLGIIGTGTMGVAKGVETSANITGTAIEQAGQLKDSLGLTPAQKEALEAYTKAAKNTKRDIVIYDPKNQLREINARNQHDVNSPQSIIDKIEVGTHFKDALIVKGQDPNAPPEKPAESDWYFIPTVWKDGKPVDGIFVYSGYVRRLEPEEKNNLQKQ